MNVAACASLPETVRRAGTLAIAASRCKRVADIRQDVRRVDWTLAPTIPQSPQVRAGLTGLAVPRTVRKSLTAIAATCPLHLRCVPREHRTWLSSTPKMVGVFP
jgi:hypothetical protein